MKKRQIKVDADILDMIADSTKLSEAQKVSFLKFIGYMNRKEIDELRAIV